MKFLTSSILLITWFTQAGSSAGVTGNTPRLVPTSKARDLGQPKFSLAVGDAVPPLEGLGLKGEPVRILFKDVAVPTVIYVITPFGPWVERNEANFAHLVAKGQKRFRFVVLSAEREEDGRLSSYVEKVQTDWGGAQVVVIAGLTESRKAALLLGAYPQTLVVSPGGLVTANFVGAYDDKLQPKVESFFSVKLPGLSAKR